MGSETLFSSRICLTISRAACLKPNEGVYLSGRQMDTDRLERTAQTQWLGCACAQEGTIHTRHQFYFHMARRSSSILQIGFLRFEFPPPGNRKSRITSTRPACRQASER